MARAFYTVDLLQGSVPFNGGAISGSLVNGNGTAVDTSGATGVLVEIQELAGGTATVTPQGSFDGITWYALGFQPVDATLAPARTVTAISVTANAKHVYQILDLYPQLRVVVSSVAGGASILARTYTTAY